jgi:hypothetical protein
MSHESSRRAMRYNPLHSQGVQAIARKALLPKSHSLEKIVKKNRRDY